MPKPPFFIVLVLFSILFSACNFPTTQKTGPGTPPIPNESLVETHPVDPIFNSFYAYLGGEEVLGPAITPLLVSGNLKSQYVEAGLMISDPQAPESERHRLAPLGLVLGISEPPIPAPADPNLRFMNGHVIYPEFVQFYEKLGGAQFVGRPLTEARHNPEKNRTEQYFENLGFYRLDWDEPGTVRLLAYGAFACDQRCRYQAPTASIPGLRAILPEPFASKAARLGLNLLGRTLSEPHLAEDGQLEVIFENVVLVIAPDEAEPAPLSFQIWLPQLLQAAGEADREQVRFSIHIWLPVALLGRPDEPAREEVVVSVHLFLPLVFNGPPAEPELVSLRPIVALLDIPAQPPVPRNPDPLMNFYAVDGELGYNVPVLLNDWILRNGGLEVSGLPTGEMTALGNGVYRQCFTNLCLELDTLAPAGQQLRPAALGVLYKERFYPGDRDGPKENSLDGLRLRAWEGKPYVSPVESQEIHASVTEAGLPLANCETVLTLTLPDNSRQVYRVQPTDERGETVLRLGPIAAPNGTLVPYEVCLSGNKDQRLCVSDHYLIWGSR
jgi:hypothetical protein